MPTPKTTTKAAAKPRAAKPRTDRAKRPSPPDRDGDGSAGGSLAGNTTAAGALGTADAALAHEVLATEPTATIILQAATVGRKTHHPVGVNGRIKRFEVGVEVQVNAAELEALENSHVPFETVVPLSETAAGEGEGSVEGSAESSPELPAAPVEGATVDETTKDETKPDEGEGGGGGQPPEAATLGEGETSPA